MVGTIIAGCSVLHGDKREILREQIRLPMRSLRAEDDGPGSDRCSPSSAHVAGPSVVHQDTQSVGRDLFPLCRPCFSSAYFCRKCAVRSGMSSRRRRSGGSGDRDDV